MSQTSFLDVDTANLGLTAEGYESFALECLVPPAAQDFWTWCENELIMPNGNAWNPRRAELFRPWYRLFQARLSGRSDDRDPHAHLAEQVYLCFGAQVTKSMLARAVLLYCISNHPRKMGFYRNRLEDLKNDRITKLQRQLELMPNLEALLPRGQEARERALGARAWTIGTSLLFWKCGAVADDWRADDLELMMLDEFDTYPLDVEGYGDPIDQGAARQRTYRKTKLLAGMSTPGVISGHCWSRLCTGTHERPLIDCPFCQGAQDLNHRQVVLTEGRPLIAIEASEIGIQQLARFACRHCGALWTDAELQEAIRSTVNLDRPWCPGKWAITPEHPNGRWTPHAEFDGAGRLIAIPPPQSVIRSGWASSLYSPDETLNSFAMKAALAQQGTVSKLKTFLNNEAAEPSIIVVHDADTDDIAQRTQDETPYQFGELHRTAKYLALHLDQQGNTREKYWFPWVLRAVEPGVGCWLVDAGKAMSDDEATQLESQMWNIGGTMMRPTTVSRDSANGNYLFDAYRWAAGAKGGVKRLLLRGDPRLADGVPWQLVVDDPKRRRRTPIPAGVKEWRISPHYWRTRMWDRIRGIEVGPKWYLPTDAPEWYLASLTSEEQVTEQRRVTGQGYRDVVVWRPRVVFSVADKQTFREDNHWWDAEASIEALSSIMGWDKKPTIILPRAPVESSGGWMADF